MIYLNYIFDLGVITIIFGWVWGLISGAIAMLLGISRIPVEVIRPSLKGVGFYIMSGLIAARTLEIAQEQEAWQSIALILLGGLVVFSHANANLQRSARVKITVNDQEVPTWRISRYKSSLVILAVLFYGAAIALPFLSQNAITTWFGNAIDAVFSWPILGWLIKVFALFFLIAMLRRGIRATHKILDAIQSLFTSKGDDDITHY